MLATRTMLNADGLRRALALASAALVLALTIFAASPTAHEWLHDADITLEDHDCAIVLFASGVSLPVGPVHVTPPVEARARVSPATAAEVFLVCPRYLRQPERGPPTVSVS
jgi:hypothetical protein